MSLHRRIVEHMSKAALHEMVAQLYRQLADMNLAAGDAEDSTTCRSLARLHDEAAAIHQTQGRQYTAKQVLELVGTALGQKGT